MMMGKSLYDLVVKSSFLPLKLKRPLIMQYEISDEFLKFSDQNKTHRASSRGRAVHTSGRKEHIDVALEL
ncbi:hypothetical protein QL285_033888 [Trifolium repens]|nr:hypothetical protein QL285_033888 [Trifolium repens]